LKLRRQAWDGILNKKGEDRRHAKGGKEGRRALFGKKRGTSRAEKKGKVLARGGHKLSFHRGGGRVILRTRLGFIDEVKRGGYQDGITRDRGTIRG